MTVITTRNLHEHTAQEVFDYVCRKVIEQGAPSVRFEANDEGACLYRGPNGTKCAVGFLIDDADYVPEFEAGYTARTLLRDYSEKLGWQKGAHDYLLQQMQGHAHDVAARQSRGDNAEFLRLFKLYAANVARYVGGIATTVLDA
jgi:hypothetical protein